MSQDPNAFPDSREPKSNKFDEDFSPPPPTYRERLVTILSKRLKTAAYYDLLTTEIRNHWYLESTYYRYFTNATIFQPPAYQADALIITFKVIINSIAQTGGIDTALLSLTRALVGGADRHVATNLDGYFLLLSAFNLRLYYAASETSPITLVVERKIRSDLMYTLKRISPQAPKLGTEDPPESGRIEIDNLVEFWYDLTWNKEFADVGFNIGDFVNALCGAVAVSILDSKGAITTPMLPGSEGSKKRPLNVGRRAIGSAAGLPALHLLSIR